MRTLNHYLGSGCIVVGAGLAAHDLEQSVGLAHGSAVVLLLVGATAAYALLVRATMRDMFDD